MIKTGEQKIEWKFHKPEHYPCSVCGVNYAEWIVTLDNIINLVVCKECRDNETYNPHDNGR